MRCHFGATCKVVAGVAKCACELPCIESGGPVCGSDGKTHPSLCALLKEKCTEQRDINLIKTEPCGESLVVLKELSSLLLCSLLLCSPCFCSALLCSALQVLSLVQF